ncbi:hypothetical protein EMIT0P218_420008 [Pseudomonas sp. IT-P218]
MTCRRRRPDKRPGLKRTHSPVGAAEGCDLLIFKIKRSQPSAAPTEGSPRNVQGCPPILKPLPP